MADNQRQLEIVVNAKDEASRKIETMGEKMGGIFAKVGIAAAASAAAIGAFAVSSINKFSEVGDAVEKMATRTGAGAESISALRVAADGAGTTIETVESGILKMSLNMKKAADGTTALDGLFKKLNVSTKNLASQDPAEQFATIGNAIGKIHDPIQRAQALVEAFGKSGAELGPLFANGSLSMEEMYQKAQKLGVAFDDISAAKAAALNDAMGDLHNAFEGLSLQIGGALAPVVTKAINKFIEWLPVIQELGGVISERLSAAFALVSAKVGELIAWLEKTGILDAFKNLLLQLWNAISIYLWPAIIQLWNALQPLMPLLQAIGVVIGGIIVGAIAAFIAVLTIAIQWVSKFITKVSETVKTILDFLHPALKTTEDFFHSMGETINTITTKIKAFVDGVKAAVEAIATLVSKKDKLDSKSSSPAISGARASGGSVLGGQSYLVGERGPELFTPSSSGFISPNAGGGVGNVNVTLNVGTVNSAVDVRRMADMVGDTIMGRVAANQRI